MQPQQSLTPHVPDHRRWTQWQGQDIFCGSSIAGPPACQLIPSKKMVSMISLAADECVSSPHNARGVVFKSEVKQLLGLGTRVLSLASYELEQVE